MYLEWIKVKTKQENGKGSQRANKTNASWDNQLDIFPMEGLIVIIILILTTLFFVLTLVRHFGKCITYRIFSILIVTIEAGCLTSPLHIWRNEGSGRVCGFTRPHGPVAKAQYLFYHTILCSFPNQHLFCPIYQLLLIAFLIRAFRKFLCVPVNCFWCLIFLLIGNSKNGVSRISFSGPPCYRVHVCVPPKYIHWSPKFIYIEALTPMGWY